jgi:hypothetical protein
MKRPTEQPWWVNATDLPPWFGDFEKAWVEAGICDWRGAPDPHPQEPAMFAWWWFKTHPCIPCHIDQPGGTADDQD